MHAPKILIVGDSWSAGEWDRSLSDIVQNAKKYSISRYLRELGYEVIHKPFPGWGDSESLAILNKHKFDYIVFFKTCATRDFKLLSKDRNLKWFNTKSIFKKIDLVNDAVYSYLNSYSDKLIIFGGLEKIRDSFNCFLKLPSIVEYIYPEFSDSEYFGDISHYEMFTDDDKPGSLKLMNLAENKLNFLKSKPKHFYPDGTHPNRLVHKSLSEFVHNHLS